MSFARNLLATVAAVATTVQFGFIQQGQASGYEKGIMWGGRSAGVAGIASPYITGSQALYFNPAGLANDKEGQDAAFNLSLLNAKFKGPINNNNDIESSKDKLLTPLGLTYNYTPNDRWGFGVGYFVSGGAAARYENVAMPNGTVTVDTDLQVSELSLGAGYKISEDFKVGIAYRIVMAKAEFGLLNRGAGFYANTQVTDLKANDFASVRLGAQYRLAEHTRLGFVYRSEVNLKADGTVQTSVNSAASAGGVGATAKTTFPMQAALSVQQDYTDWRALGEYVWSQYSRVGEISLQNNSTGGTNYVPMNWKDEHQIRLAGEYLGFSYPIRFGYAWTSTVTDKDMARPSFAPPAPAHTLTLGTGQIFQLMNNPIQFDAAGEYTFASADGGTAVAGDTTNDFRAGTYSVSAYALHLGVTYAF